MKHMACEKIALLGVFAIAGCYSYASDAINNTDYNTVVAAPNFINIKSGDSDQVIVRLTNANGFGAITGYTVSAVGSGIRVDSSCTVPDLAPAQQSVASCNGYYRPVFDASKDTLVPSGPSNQAQFYVVGLATGQYTFTVTPKSVNTGVSTTVTVVVQPITLGPGLSKTTAVAGDTVVITAPAGAVFSSKSTVTFPTGQTAIIGLSADSTKITLIAGPGISGAATITRVGVAANPAVPPVTLVTSNTLTSPAVTVAPTTVSTTTPLLGASMTVTLGGSLRFTPTSTILFGGNPVIIVSRSADSSTATVVPTITGGVIASGVVSYTNIVLSFLNTVPLSLPGNQTVTVNTSVFDPNSTTIGTASTITLAASGHSIWVGGSGAFTNSGPCGVTGSGDGCQWFTVVLAATTTIDIDARWQGGSDNGLYVLNAAGTAIVTSADAGGQGSSGQPETKTATLPAGTYYFGQVFFGTGSGYPPSANTVAPAYYLWQITTH